MTFTQVQERLRNGLWFLPTLLMAGSAGLAVLLPVLDHQWDLPAITADPDTARQVMVAVATGTVTFAGLVFSITIVALQLTSSQFSPRALRQFLRDRPSQVALGTFAGVFLFDLLVLARVEGGPDPFVPGMSVDFVLLGGATSVFTFIGFVSHITQSIRVVHIVENIAVETHQTARRLQRAQDGDPAPGEVLADLVRGERIRLEGRGGVLQHLDVGALVHLSVRHDVVLEVVPETGDYVPEGAPVVEVWGKPDRSTGTLAWSDVAHSIEFGPERTMTSDVAFGYRQLADIGAKALSPALNDPTTAVQCVDRLHDLLRVEVGRPRIARVHRDADGVVRLVHAAIRWDELLSLAFDEIRIYGSGSMQIMRRIRAALEDLGSVADPQQQEALDVQIGLLDRAIRRSFDDPVDRAHAGVADEQGLGDDGD